VTGTATLDANGLTVNDQPLTIGAENSSSLGYWFNGQMDEIVVFNDVISADEATEIAKGLYDSPTLTTSTTTTTSSSTTTISTTTSSTFSSTTTSTEPPFGNQLVSQVVGQVEWTQSDSKQMASQVVGQTEYVDLNDIPAPAYGAPYVLAEWDGDDSW